MPKYCLGEISSEIRETYKGDKSGYPIVGLEHLVPEEITLSKWDVDTDNTFTKMFREGDILFGRRRAYLKKASVAPFDGICSGDITVIRANEKIVAPELLPFIIQNDEFFEFAVEKSAGSLSPRAKWDHVKNYEIILPDIEEQRRIAGTLWTIDAACRAYNRLLVETDELIKAQFRKMIETSGNENTLGDFLSRYSPQRCGNRELPVLSVTKERAIVFQDERFDSTVASRDKSGYLVVPKGFIVQGIHIDEGNFGLQNIADEGIVSPAYKIWKIISDNVVPELLEFYLRSDRAIEYYKHNYQGTTVKRRQTIKDADLLAMPLNIPDLGGQQWFWQFVCQSQKSMDALRKTSNEARALQSRIVRDNFVIAGRESL